MQNELIDKYEKNKEYQEKTLTQEELEDSQQSIEPDNPAEITYRVIDPDIFSLVRRFDQGSIVIPSFGNINNFEDIQSNDKVGVLGNFQRGFVWRRQQMDKFLETLLLRYPIPGIILIDRGKDPKTGRDLWYVLDGQQRMTTLHRFMKKNYRISNSDQILKKFRGKKFDELDNFDREQLENYPINTTVIRSVPDSDNLKSIYKIYERINSGGTQLTPHEIRIAIYSGPLADRIEEINLWDIWRSMYGQKNTRLRDHELISRIIAMHLGWKKYTKPLKGFLNNFYEENQTITPAVIDAIKLFKSATQKLYAAQGAEVLRRGDKSRPINTAASEAVYVGLMSRMLISDISSEDINERLNKLWTDEEFQYFIEGSTSDKPFVENRIQICIEKFKAD